MTPDIPAHILESCERSGTSYRNTQIEATANAYDRIRHLPMILKTITEDELKDFSVEGSTKIVDRLDALSKNTRNADHWNYDVNHRFAILGALKAERRMLLETLNAQGLANIFVRAGE